MEKEDEKVLQQCRRCLVFTEECFKDRNGRWIEGLCKACKKLRDDSWKG